MKRSAILIACATACAVGPDFRRPPPPQVSRYTSKGVRETITAGGVAQTVRPGEQLAATWWQLFRSSPVDELVRTALTNNPSIEAASASLRQSEYSLRAGRGVFFPQVDVNAGVMRQRFSVARFGQTMPSHVFNLYTAAGTIGYTLDIFGGERRKVEALRAQVDVQCFTLAAARLTVTGNVVNTAIARAAYAEEIAATEQLVTSLRGQIDIARAQERAGTGTAAAVFALETQAETTAATIPPLRQQLAEANALLATLLGRAPAEWQAPALRLADFTLPRALPVSLPSELVRQRPDVLIAEATLHAASANIGVATAAMFPSFTFDSSFGLNSTLLSRLFDHNSHVWSIAGNLLAPVFHGGTLNNQRHAAIEAYRQSFASYRQTVLGAFSDVANSLEALVHDAEALTARERALTAATESRRLTLVNFDSGLVDYIAVLVAEGQYHEARISHLEAEALRLQDMVGLFIALGGGWWSMSDLGCARDAGTHAVRR